ncbi:hypothetical protein RUMHYD_02585 [Blautia hydrogenotrophica DSM 10507]|uniref:Uncharacterized protein n=1 Tax=Blautia hydrogenotrophica (strain DSM 10507 / JCM 14656 / S5a33) TaxID=476272 RepID=C0CNY4_BLAHS|nr:hypothetical protein RUMHYD_02585 [Blautia hydrogenotrophica DSM 10507]
MNSILPYIPVKAVLIGALSHILAHFKDRNPPATAVCRNYYKKHLPGGGYSHRQVFFY